MRIGFLGLGVMGYPMAGHLQANGHQVWVYNRTASKATKWQQQFGGNVAATPAEVAREVEILCLCVGNDEDVRQVLLGTDGAIHSLAAGSLIIDHTTASAQVARELDAVARDNGLHFIDAPVSGGQAGAENGKLTIMVGAAEQDFERAVPVFDCYGRYAKCLGPVGSGQLAKMMNQICIAGVVQGLAEALHFGQQAGLDGNAVVDVISKGAAQSWQMENRAATMLAGQFDFGFAVDWMRKDLALALNEGQKNGSSLPLTALVDQFYADVQRDGGGRWDTSSLLTRFKR